MCERIKTTHEPTWTISYIPCAIKPVKRMSKFHLTAGCISARVVWGPSLVSSQSNFVGSVTGMSATMETGVSTPGTACPALPVRCFLIRSELDFGRPSPKSAKRPPGVSIRTPRWEGETALTISLKTERCNFSPWMTGREFKPRA